jgi:23S rRNA (cytidine1920-2'-O)/16S rRNA (cytidine1409-2'-O)-methyltransferase
MSVPSHPDARERLDKAMLARGLVASRARAQDLIRRGLVQVAGQTATAPGRLVRPDEVIAIPEQPAGHSLVSRGGEKLAAALAHYGFSAQTTVALDVGASTGGFTQVLLAADAARVYAIDVGHGQLHATIAADPRVVHHEGLDARDLGEAHVPEAVGAIVADVSFISLMKVLPAALARAGEQCWFVGLIKPQFEVGRAHVGKGGIVRDADARQRAVDDITAFVAAQPGWRVAGVIPSPIAGGSGNLEFLLGATKGVPADGG